MGLRGRFGVCGDQLMTKISGEQSWLAVRINENSIELVKNMETMTVARDDFPKLYQCVEKAQDLLRAYGPYPVSLSAAPAAGALASYSEIEVSHASPMKVLKKLMNC